MLANLPVEIILLICEYPEFKDLGQLAWTNNRMMRIIKKYLPMALERKTLLYILVRYQNGNFWEGRICLFDSHTNSVEQIAKFTYCLSPWEVIITKDKIFALNSFKESSEIFDLNTRQIKKGPDPPEWRNGASVAYFKDKLYYLGGKDPETEKATDRVDVLIDGEWETGPALPCLISYARTITCDDILYVLNGWWETIIIYRLSDDEREWIEIGEIPERVSFGVASLNGRIYITGGLNDGGTLKSCLCFDPSAPVDSRISRITYMNYARWGHSLIATNGKLYVIGGFQNSIEEYDPQANKWREVGKNNLHKTLFYLFYWNNDEYEGRIYLFKSYDYSVEEIAKFSKSYVPYQVATTQNKIFGISSSEKSFEIYDLDTRQIARGLDPPEWRKCASVAYFKDKLYYLGGEDPKTEEDTNRVDILIDGKWQTGPAFPLPIEKAQIIACDEILYVLDGLNSQKIFRLSDDEREWIESGELPEKRYHFGVASLNGKIYITGGVKGMNDDDEVFKSCLCFDPSAPVDSRISRIADMNYERYCHPLIVVNESLYAIGGFQQSIEEYDPKANKWRKVGRLT